MNNFKGFGIHWFLVMLACLFINACGSSGGSDSGNKSPVISDQLLTTMESTDLVITLGLVSDGDGDLITYRAIGTTNTRDGGQSNQIIYNNVTLETEVFKVEASDKINPPVSAVITVVVSEASGNSQPVANAGTNQSVITNSNVTLDGSGSSDADLDDLTYLWSFTSTPADSTATLSDTAGVSPDFDADLDGTYVLQLIVNDGTMDSTPTTVTITASLGGDGLRKLVNPEYTYVDNFESPLDNSFWFKSINNSIQAADPTNSANKVIESLYGDLQARQESGDSWSELTGVLPVRAVQIEFGFREYTPASYDVSQVLNHKTIGAHSGTYGIFNSNISIRSECWPRTGGGTPSIYTGYDGTNRGHIMSPGDPLLWEEGDGQWHDIHAFMQLPEKPGEYGIYELYRDGQLFLSNRFENLPDSWDDITADKLIGFVTRGHYLDEIRLYGWANGVTGLDAFTSPTHFLHDNFYLHANSIHGKTIGGTELSTIRETPVVLYQYDFNDNQAPSIGNGLSYGSQSGGAMDFSRGSLSVQYPANAFEMHNWWGMSVLDQQTSEIFVEFDARMPAGKHGVKFLKIFGENLDGKYANVTFGLDYTGIDNGGMLMVSYGDGASTQNDTAHVIWLDGSNPSLIGRSYGKTAHVVTPQKKVFASTDWGSDWHHFRFYWKFDTATTLVEEENDNRYGKANGACYLEIDGVPYVIATGLLNRHFTNSLNINAVALADWVQNNSSSFTIEYDNINITTGGFQ